MTITDSRALASTFRNPRRRIDRIAALFAAVHESENGPTLTSGDVRYRAAVGGIADINGI